MISQAAPPIANIRIDWDIGNQPIDTNTFFQVYQTDNASTFIGDGALIATVPCNLRSVIVAVAPGFHSFGVRATNVWWGIAGDFSNVASTPGVMDGGKATMTITRVP